VYFFTRFGLTQMGTIEERPGIPPSPAHLARLIRTMKDEQVKVVVAEPWSDQQMTSRVAEQAGAKIAVVNAKLGQASGSNAYIASTDANVSAVAQAFR
jgi:zinc/manganese transport system substrate-binding protein